MGAGTLGERFRAGAETPTLCLVDQGMNATTHTVNESDGTTDAPADDRPVLDLDNAEPASVPGATVIFAPAYARTGDGAALRYDGDVPVVAVGVYSEIDAREALGECYEAADIDRAFRVGEWLSRERPTRATEIVSHAEGGVDRGEGVATDGGRELTGDHPLDVQCNQCGSDYRVDETVSNDCPECGFIDFDVVDSDPDVATDDGVDTGEGVVTDGGTVTLHPCSTCDGQAKGDAEQCPECQRRGVSEVDETPL